MSRYSWGLVMLFVGAVSVLIGGCGPQFTFIPVQGTITKGGRPLRGIEVIFLADPDTGTLGPRATGRTDAAGQYRLRTERNEDGVVAGKYRVVLLDLEAAKGGRGGTFGGPQPKEVLRMPPEAAKHLKDQRNTTGDALRVPPRYASINETPLRADVHPGSQTFDFNIP